jgi:hypothetical protein
VEKSIPPYAIAVGFPARVLKYRFEQTQIERLLRVKWWSWPRERIVKALPLMLSTDISAFLEFAEGTLP